MIVVRVGDNEYTIMGVSKDEWESYSKSSQQEIVAQIIFKHNSIEVVYA